MPTYVYEIINEDDSGGEKFEVIQRMSDAELKKHPETGQPVRRLIQPAAINTKGSEKRFLDPDYQASKGFTRYEKSGDGTYEKVAGEGPKNIAKDDYVQ
ncbi:MAG: FmdB family transcriptional regulator [Planctomycetota bacterium]|jgi:predicted nucleic acid-binding Zn ribbon protein|nr:FmdB family transcriptional regulator [Planctomycetota bacterium]MDP7128964.1 FmdB family transcriptional regulator [Planctomycetota bacterium]